MSENEQDVPQQGAAAEHAAPPTEHSPAEHPSVEHPPAAPAESTASGEAPSEGAGTPTGERPSERQGGRKRRRGGKGGGGGAPGQPNPRHAHAPHGGGPHGGGHHGHGHRYVEDRIDLDAEQLARESRSIGFAKLRPIVAFTHQARRLLTSSDPHDRREARRALVLFKSKIAFLAGRESGRERNAFVRIRDFLMKGIDQVTHDRETLDPQQARNFLDNVDAFVGYHRFHCDDRRRD